MKLHSIDSYPILEKVYHGFTRGFLKNGNFFYPKVFIGSCEAVPVGFNTLLVEPKKPVVLEKPLFLIWDLRGSDCFETALQTIQQYPSLTLGLFFDRHQKKKIEEALMFFNEKITIFVLDQNPSLGQFYLDSQDPIFEQTIFVSNLNLTTPVCGFNQPQSLGYFGLLEVAVESCQPLTRGFCITKQVHEKLKPYLDSKVLGFSEHQFEESWDGLDHVIVDVHQINDHTLRKLQGFEAALGQVLSYDNHPKLNVQLL